MVASPGDVEITSYPPAVSCLRTVWNGLRIDAIKVESKTSIFDVKPRDAQGPLLFVCMAYSRLERMLESPFQTYSLEATDNVT